jgi:anti-sigma factor RsiW
MRCEDLERDLACFVDGELASPEEREVRNHLEVCPQCKAHVEEQRQIKKALRTSGQPVPSADFLSRMSSSLQEIEPVRPSEVASVAEGHPESTGRAKAGPARSLLRASVGVFVPLAAALALVLGYVETIEPVINESIVRHQRNLPLEVTGGPEQVSNWFNGKVPFAVSMPKLGPRVSLLGGRISHLRGREAALLQYDQNGQRISVFVFDAHGMQSPLPLRAPERRMIGNHEVFIEDTSGYHVAFFRDRGLGYAITGNVDESDFIQMISAAIGQNSGR